MKNKFSFFAFLILAFGCNYKVVELANTESQLNLKKNNIVDLSKIMEFKFTTNELLIKDEESVNRLCNYLIDHRLKCQILIQCKHEDRYYINVLFANIEDLKSFLVKRGIDEKKISPEVGFDFGTIYSPELTNSKLIMIIK